jgi:hypothetical protein
MLARVHHSVFVKNFAMPVKVTLLLPQPTFWVGAVPVFGDAILAPMALVDWPVPCATLAPHDTATGRPSICAATDTCTKPYWLKQPPFPTYG